MQAILRRGKAFEALKKPREALQVQSISSLTNYKQIAAMDSITASITGSVTASINLPSNPHLCTQDYKKAQELSPGSVSRGNHYVITM